MIDVVVSAIAGVISGGIASLLAPWATWGVEQKRSRQDRRMALIAEARKMLNEPPSNAEFRISELYSRLRPHLSPRSVQAIEGKSDRFGNEIINVVIGESRGAGVNPYAHLVLDELAELERKWGLM